jgi:hypothetical protein
LYSRHWEGVATVMLLNVVIILSFSSCRSEVEVLGEILNLNIHIGKTKALGMPWDIVKDKEDLECQNF